jgi:predicted permease
MNFLSVFAKMVELFLIIILGYAATRIGIMNRTVKASLSKIILNISMPCTILASVMMADSLPGVRQILRLLVVSFLTYVVLYVLAKMTSFLLRLKGARKAAAEFGILFANVGFIGFPVTYAIFGAESTFYTSVFNMPFNLLCYSLGVYLIQKGKQEDRLADEKIEPVLENAGNQGSKSAKTLVKAAADLVLNPGLIAAVIGLVMALVGWQGPLLLGETCELVGGITTPGALLIIGAALAEMPIAEMFNNGKAYLVTFISVIVTPVVMYLVFAPFTASDPLLLGETVIISAMPVATAGTMLCVEYGGDEKFMAQITFLSTLISVVSIPVIAMVL